MSSSLASNDQDIFIFYAREGTISELKELIDSVDINAGDSISNTTALIEATKHNHAKTVEYLCQQQSIALDHETPNSEVALMEATKNNSPTIAEILLKHGANPNVQLKNGNVTPLHEACKKGYVEMIEILKKYKANPLIEDNEMNIPINYIPDHLKVNMLNYINSFGTKKGSQREKRQKSGSGRRSRIITDEDLKEDDKSATNHTLNEEETKVVKGKGRERRESREAKDKENKETKDSQDTKEIDGTNEHEGGDDMEDMEDTQITPIRSGRRGSGSTLGVASTANNRNGARKQHKTRIRTISKEPREIPASYKRIASRVLKEEAVNFYKKMTETFLRFAHNNDEVAYKEFSDMLYSSEFQPIYDSILESTQQVVYMEE